MTPPVYSYILEPYRGPQSRHTCPQCGRRREFTRYIDSETGHPLADPVGKCNRESKCGYHYPPRAYFRDHPKLGKIPSWRQSDLWQTTYQAPEAKPIDDIPRRLMERSWRRYEDNNFVRYLSRLFGPEKALELARQFHLGTSRHWRNHDGLAVVFWQVDRQQRVRQAKVMAYHPETGRRLKAKDEAYRYSRKTKSYFPDTGRGAKVYFAGRSLIGREAHLQQCFFGEHQLAGRPDDLIALVESEKTAVIMSAIFPAVIWLATGGTNGARWTDRSVYQSLADRRVICYPDLGAYPKWSEQAKILGTVCDVSVSDLLERKATATNQEAGYDLADFFVPFFAPGGSGGRPYIDFFALGFGEKGDVKLNEDPGVPEGTPPGCFWETGKDRHGQLYRVLVDESGVPVGW